MRRFTIALLTAAAITMTACGGAKEKDIEPVKEPVQEETTGIETTAEEETEPLTETEEAAESQTEEVSQGTEEAADPMAEEVTEPTEGETGAQAYNKALIKPLLGDEDIDPLIPGNEDGGRAVRSVMTILDMIEAGQLAGAEIEDGEAEGEKVLSVYTEDETLYRIYISASGSVDAVRNMDSGEWVLRSNR